MAKRKTTTKNKGPKGKKARAKAKLERQWGEEAAPAQSKVRGQAQEPTRFDGVDKHDDDENTVSSQEEQPQLSIRMRDDQEENQEPAQAYSSLLETIRRQKQRSLDDSDEDDEEHFESHAVESDDELDEDDLNDLTVADAYTERFSNAKALPEDETARSRQLETIQETTKVAVTAASSSPLEVTLSKSLLTDLQLDGDAAGSSVQDWKRRSQARARAKRTEIRASIPSDPLGHILGATVHHYPDVLLTTTQSSASKKQNSHNDTMNVVLAHVLQHLLTRHTRIHKHNASLKSDESTVAIDDAVLRDQGYHRPTVLILLPTRGTCYQVIQSLLSMLPNDDDNDDSERLERLTQEYGPPIVVEGDDEKKQAAAGHRKKVLAQKGREWLELFGDDVNDDDDFKMGISLQQRRKKGKGSSTKEYSLKLFCDFYKSDIVLASPLALKMATTNEEGVVSADFLSSIEICLVGRADVLLMQNWSHVNDVLATVNQPPKDTKDTDFSRVRQYMLLGQAQHWRQTILLSQVSDPRLVRTFKRFAQSRHGLVKVRAKVTDEHASIARVLLPTRQVFQRIPTTSLATHAQDRVQYVTDQVLPEIYRQNRTHTLLFIPSYFDFVAIRNVLLKRQCDFCSVTEYARVSETTRGRARFLQGRKPVLLYTGRAHYFLRHAIKGVKHVIFCGLPEHAAFYADHVNLLQQQQNSHDDDEEATSVAPSALVLFTKYDSHALEGVVGSRNCQRMIKNGEQSTFVFAS